MAHLDPDLLALLALGEDAASPLDRLHLAGCRQCRSEVRRFAHPAAPTPERHEPLVQPAPHVWTAIMEEARLDPRFAADPLTAAGPRAVASPASRPFRSGGMRTRRGLVAVVAAAAVVLVGVGVGVAAGLLAARPGAQQIAAATLEPLPDWPGRSGTAVLERLPDGRRVVQVQATVQPGSGTDHEVWLMTAGARQLVSLGLLRGRSGTFAVPAEVDLSRYDLVDISDEPRDGDPAHSGDSIVRGALTS